MTFFLSHFAPPPVLISHSLCSDVLCALLFAGVFESRVDLPLPPLSLTFLEFVDQ